MSLTIGETPGNGCLTQTLKFYKMENIKKIMDLASKGKAVELKTKDEWDVSIDWGVLKKGIRCFPDEWVLMWNGQIIKSVKTKKIMKDKLIQLQNDNGHLHIEDVWENKV